MTLFHQIEALFNGQFAEPSTCDAFGARESGRASRFEIRRVQAQHLSEAQREEMWRCYSQFADGRRDQFLETIATADEAFLFYSRDSGAMTGFEAIRVLTVEFRGHPYTVIYSHYADLKPPARGLNLLQRVAVGKFLRMKLRHPFRPMFWMYTASTYTSYLLLPNNVVEYWPRPERATPPHLRAVVDRVMRELGKEGWDRSAGVVRRHGALRYREGIVNSDPARLKNPHIRFYAGLNPRQEEGDSLACLCPMSARNFVALVVGMVRRPWRKLRVRAH